MSRSPFPFSFLFRISLRSLLARNMAGYGRIFSIVGTTASYRNLLPNRNVLMNLQRCVVLKAKELEKLGLPPKPKRPLTPFFKFMSNERDRVKKEAPSLTSRQIISQVARNWAIFDPSQKEKLQKAYDEELLAYSTEVMVYDQSITPKQKKIMKEAKKKAGKKAEKAKLRKKIEELGRPKRPPTGFIQYMQELKFARNKDDKVINWLQTVAEKWRTMTADEKFKYQLESQKLMNQYKHDIREWEEKMVRLGHIDVVRNRGLIDLKVESSAAKLE